MTLIRSVDLREACREWVMASTGLAHKQVFRGHQNGTAGPGANLPYITVTPIVRARPRGVEAMRFKDAQGRRWRAREWIVQGQIDAYRPYNVDGVQLEPADLLMLCEDGLKTPGTPNKPGPYRAFMTRHITARSIGEILSSPATRGQDWDEHAQMLLQFTFVSAVEEEVQKATGVRIRFKINASEDRTELVEIEEE